MNKIENKIFIIYCKINPTSAFKDGIKKYRDKLFIPTKEKVNVLKSELKKIKKLTKNKEYLGYVDSLLQQLDDLNLCLWVGDLNFMLIYYRIKKLNTKKLINQFIDLFRELNSQKIKINDGQKLMLYDIISEFDETLETFKIKNNELKKEIKKIYDKFNLIDTIKNKKRILSNKKAFFNPNYKNLLKKGFSMYESPYKIRKLNEKWLNNAINKHKKLILKLKKKYKVKTKHQLKKKLHKKINKKQIIKLNKILGELINKYIITIPKNHNVKIAETPSYLKKSIPVASVFLLDSYTNPNSLFYYTVNKYLTAGFMINLIVHENYAHAINQTYSSANKPIRRMDTPISFALAEELSVPFEFMFIKLLKRLIKINSKEIKLLQPHLDEYFYEMSKREMVIYIRALNDVAVNLGNESMKGFANKMSKKTGIDEEEILHLTYYRQQRPGYPTTYPICGKKYLELLKKSKLSLKDFNKQAFSLGFIPRKVFEEKLRKLK